MGGGETLPLALSAAGNFPKPSQSRTKPLVTYGDKMSLQKTEISSVLGKLSGGPPAGDGRRPYPGLL